MAVRIRLTRVGATKQPAYRIVVADARSARDSRSIETLGHYNPRTTPVELNVDGDKAKAWIAKGAKPSETVARLLRDAGVLPAEQATEKPAKAKASKAKAAAKAEAAAE
ncbi:MAG TPA: 30S ribosomal protein S16 [Candidatus Binatia bacterium]|nr:30S ribosomal protein S16 [Candidatus Binatia bacterium]